MRSDSLKALIEHHANQTGRPLDVPPPPPEVDEAGDDPVDEIEMAEMADVKHPNPRMGLTPLEQDEKFRRKLSAALRSGKETVWGCVGKRKPEDTK
jgi:hypothetical protein